MATFGQFSPDGKSYLYHDTQTPRPQMNYIWNARLLSGINHFGGGVGAYGGRAAAYIDPQGRGRCTLIRDGSRYFYVQDAGSGEYFNPGWFPSRNPVEGYCCKHSLGYSEISSTSLGGIYAHLRVFVPEEDPAEIWTVTLRNDGATPRKINLFSFADLDLTGYARYSDYNSYVHGHFYQEDNLLVCFNDAMEKPHDFFHGFMASSLAPQGFDTSRRSFIGVYGDLARPDALARKGCANSLAACEMLCVAMQHTLDLAPGQSVTLDVLIGATDGAETAQNMAKKLLAKGCIEKEFSALCQNKDTMLGAMVLQTPSEKVNLFANYWLKHQVQLCTEVGRDTGKGFRDQLQDAWAACAYNGALARDKILETLRYQFANGRAVRGWLPLDHHVYSDGPTWIPLTVNAYIKETGDTSILQEVVPYLDDGEGTVWQHILRAMRFVSDDTSFGGMVRAREGDWNDSLNMIGREGKGVSVWTSIALCWALENTAEMATEILGEHATAEEMLARRKVMAQAVNAHGWDGDWYLAAINDDGVPVGSHAEQQGKIYLNSQTWAILSGVAQGDRAKACEASLDTLLSSEYGPLTLYPAYRKFNNRIGRLSSFVPGIWENGTPYCHGGAFKVVADFFSGRGDIGFETMLKILPDSPSNPSDQSGCEPFALTNMYFGPENPRKGETLFAWVTGTAGWMFRAMTQYLAGFFPGHGTITIDPCMPQDWPQITMVRPYRGAVYHITIDNPNHVQKGVVKLIVDGNAIEGNTFAAFASGDHTVQVTMG